ncbi:hypothetical protein RKE29_07990 [Streptomyces sp. B1866]|uniref:hypothetical protein n=1 Tax=Streptomyces sp. B1866 TaxID=3075431 RepID=UPI00288CC8D2|nr:hypothetical protein [Streptomyces sp. B1866]MDT3396582.1 hypothetical protein [Streptomyces sp. B1866]
MAARPPYPPPHPYVPPGPVPPAPPGRRRPGRPGPSGRPGEDWPTARELLSRSRRSGCLLVLTLPFMGAPLVIYAMYRSARRSAHRVFAGDGAARVHDHDVARLKGYRAVAGFAVSLLVLAVYGAEKDWSEFTNGGMIRIAITPWLLLGSAPLVIWLMLRTAADHRRPAMKSALRGPLRSALVYVGVLTAAVAARFTVNALGGLKDTGKSVSATAVVATFAVMLVFAWLFFFLMAASIVLARNGFRTEEVHATLPALLTAVLVWEFAGVSLAVDGLPPGPPLVQAVAFVGGPASVSALAWWEIHRLRTRHGVRLRG